MRFKFVSLLLAGLISLLASCSPEHSQIIVAEYGDYKITMDEFEKAYAQNVGGIENAKKDSLQNLEKFLDLYLKFKMKLRDATVRGFDKEESLQKEFLDYKNKIGTSYIKEKMVVDPGLKQLHERRQNELRVAHILVRQDTLSDEETNAKAQKIIDKILAGEDWNEACKLYSQDNNSKLLGGDVYYVTGGVVLPQLEDALYSIKVGEVYKEPVKSRAGYHILKVTEIIPRKEKISAQHILVKSAAPISQTDTAALSKITDALNKIKSGADFGELAKELSDDPGSGKNGGELGFFERRMMVKPFDEAAFKLKEGEVSDIVRTRFGYHIIKVNKIEYPLSLDNDNEKKKLSKVYKKTRYENELKDFIESLKPEVKLSLNKSGIDFVASKLSEVLLKDYLESDEKFGVSDTVLYSIGKVKYTCDSLLNKKNADRTLATNKLDRNTIEVYIEKVSKDQILTAKAMILEKSDEGFALLMDEYRNGIYIFKLQEEEVWNRIQLDSLKLKEYYEANKENYQWQDRVDYFEVLVNTEEKAKEIYFKIKDENIDISILAASSTIRKGSQKKEGRFEFVNADFNEVSKIAFKMKANQLSEPIQISDDEWAVVKVVKVDPARVKTFEEAYAEVSSDYQELESEKLEKEYINKLESTYDPVLYKDELKKAYMVGSN